MKAWAVFCFALLCACGGGGGGGGATFRVSGSTPQSGDAEAPIDAALIVVFDRPADADTINLENVRLEEADGTPVSIRLFVQGFNASSFSIEPFQNLRQNVEHRIILSGGIRSEDGASLRSESICFVTRSLTPTVRPDQILDLGDALNVPRLYARSIRLRDGRVLICGGYTDPQTVTDTVEIYDPDTRTFHLLDTKMSVPRAEHSATLLNDGRVIIAGGVSTPGGDPLASVDVYDSATGTIGAGTPMLEARRWHAAGPFESGATVMVSGGYGSSGDELDTIEYLGTGTWTAITDRLPQPMARGFQILRGFDTVYFSASNLLGQGALYNGSTVRGRDEGDIRFRGAWAQVGPDRYLLVGGDTRSLRTYVFSSDIAWGATEFLVERRGGHSVTPRGLNGRRLLVVGGFNIARQGAPPLNNMEIVDALDPGPFGFPDAATHAVENVFLPVPFAGHVGFIDKGGPTVVAGGVGDGVGAHSRRVVLILDNLSSPTADCE